MEAKREGDDSSNDAGVPADLELLGRKDELCVEEAVEQRKDEDHNCSDDGKTDQD